MESDTKVVSPSCFLTLGQSLKNFSVNACTAAVAKVLYWIALLHSAFLAWH